MNSIFETMNKLIARYYLIASLTLIGLIMILMLNFLIWPQYQRMTDDGLLQDQNMASILQQRENYLEQLKLMETSYLEIDQRIMRDIAVVLPMPVSDGVIYAELEQVVTGTNFQIDSINIARLNATTADIAEAEFMTTSPYEVVSISINISSQSDQVSYADFKELLRKIEQYPHLLDLESLSYSPSESSYTFLIKTYQQQQQL